MLELTYFTELVEKDTNLLEAQTEPGGDVYITRYIVSLTLATHSCQHWVVAIRRLPTLIVNLYVVCEDLMDHITCTPDLSLVDTLWSISMCLFCDSMISSKGIFPAGMACPSL